MPVRVQCPECGTPLMAGDDRIGRNATCPRCHTKFLVNASDNDDLEDESDEEEEESSGGGLPKPEDDHGKYEDLVDMTAMVDIVFFLLIFFMITSASGILSCIAMPPPKQDGAATSSKRPADLDTDTEMVTVRIDENNRLFIEELEFPSEADLHDRLKSARAAQAKKLLVKGHGNAHHGTLVMVLDMGSALGFDPISLSVAKEEESQ